MKKYRRILSAVYGEVWGILPEKLEAIVDMLELRSDGRVFSDDEIKTRISSAFPVAQVETQEAPGIAVLSLNGTITQRTTWMSEFSGGTSTEMFGKAFDKAIADPSVKRILIDVDSPGGSVTGVEELAAKIFAARGSKPITAFASGGQIASAAYWISCAADEIVATPSCSAIGSIGVIQVHQVKQNADTTTTVIRSVPNKADVNSHEKLTESAMKNLTDKIQSIHNVFESSVAKYRGVDVKTVQSDYGQGRTFASREALKAGMIDRIATLDELLAEWGASPQTNEDVEVDVIPLKVSERIEDMKLTPKIQLALVRAQLVRAGSEEKEFQAALDLHCKAEGIAESATEEAVVASFTKSHAPTGSTVATFVQSTELRSAISDGDVSAVIRLAGNVGDSERFALHTEIMDKISAGDLTTMKGVRELVGKHKSDASVLAGAVAGDMKFGKAEADKIVDQIVSAITIDAYAGQDRSELSIVTSEGNRAIAAADVGNDARMGSPIGIARMIIERNPAIGAKAHQLSNEDIARITCGAPLADFGIGSYADGPAFNTTGLFRAVLNNSKNTVARKEYADTEVMYTKWASRGRAITNFDQHTIKALGSMTDPRAVPENGEFEEQTILGAESEKVRLNIWGGIFSNSFQMMLSDDLGFFVAVEKKMVRKLRRKQDLIVSGVLKDNPTMGDGIPLFHTSHNNVVDVTAAGDLFTQATIALARIALRRQKPVGAVENVDLGDDGEPIGLTPYAALVPPELGESAWVYFNSASQAGQSNPQIKNPHSSLLNRGGVLELDRLTATDVWYMTADPADVEFVSYHFLNNNDAPRIDVSEAFGSLSYKTRVWVPFGTSAKDYRGAVKIFV